jgi:hypothetical protein
MARTTDLGRFVVQGYYEPMSQTHATVSSLFSRLNTEKEAIVFQTESQRSLADKVLRLGHIFVLSVLDVQQERFQIPDLKAKLAICHQDLADVLAAYRARDKESV